MRCAYPKILSLLSLLLIIILAQGMLPEAVRAATERQSPDAIVTQTNLIGTITAIQDDPDSPDGNWWTALNNVSTVAHVSFPTPTGNPDAGAGVQEFRVLLRKTAINNGRTDDTYTIHLYENGVERVSTIASGSNTPTGGVVVSATWDASALTNADGSGVEVFITTTPEASGAAATRGSIEVGAVEWNVTYTPDPTFVQRNFRVYEHTDSVDPSVPWEAENATALDVPQDTAVRLRTQLEVQSGELATTTQQFALQFAENTTGDCLTVPPGNFANVGLTASTSVIWKGTTTPSVADGAEIGALLLTNSTVKGTFEEENPTAANPNAIPVGGLGEWDFLLYNNGAPSDTSYCFRMVKNGGDATAFTYQRMAEIHVVRGLTQLRYRWREDDGGETAATWSAPENIATTTQRERPLRLRLQVDNQGTGQDSAALRLEYSVKDANDWKAVPFDAGDASCASATSTTAFRLCSSTHFADQDATTHQLSAPSGKTGVDFVAGYMLESSNPAPSVTLATTEFTELEWNIEASDGAPLGTTYEFRLTDSGGVIGTYAVFPELTVVGGTPLLTQNFYRWYANADSLDPSDPWPAGAADLGENTSVTPSDEPPKPGDVLRLRTTILVEEAPLAVSSEQLRLQFGELADGQSCSAVSTWEDVSGAAVWSGFDNPSVADGTEVGALRISVADVAGTYEESNPSASNPNAAAVGDNIEYDWTIEHNGASPHTGYCFRVVYDDGGTSVPLDNDPNFYPQLTTAGFTPETRDWRWYDDAENATPSTPLAGENVAPSNLAYDNTVKVRVLVADTGGVAGENVKFRLQFSESSDFSSATFVEEAGNCDEGASLWCYADGGGSDNATISSTVLAAADACPAGCGTHNESGTTTSTYTHAADAVAEYEFTIRHAGARANATYFFRLYDTGEDAPVPTQDGGGQGYPSVAAEGATLTFAISGLPASTSTEGVTTAVETSPDAIPFGSLPIGTVTPAAQRLTVSTNATGGYSVFAYQRQGLVSGAGAEIDPVTGTNDSPVSWSLGCSSSLVGCWGYHAGDDILSGADPTRFAAHDTYARFTESPEEVAFSAGPAVDRQTDVVFNVEVRDLQESGTYESSIVYIVVTRF